MLTHIRNPDMGRFHRRLYVFYIQLEYVNIGAYFCDCISQHSKKEMKNQNITLSYVVNTSMVKIERCCITWSSLYEVSEVSR